jgi:hypothetical protein
MRKVRLSPPKLKYYQTYIKRGKRVHYVRIRDVRWLMPDPSSPEFLPRYHDILAGRLARAGDKPAPSPGGSIYVVGFHRWVKIGFSRDITKRISILQGGCPEKLQVHFVLSGTQAQEKALHTLFARHRVHGEWFEVAGELAEWINKERKIAA